MNPGKCIVRLLLFVLLPQAGLVAQPLTSATEEFVEASNKWLNAWQLVSSKIFQLPAPRQVDFVFFDAENVYASSKISAINGNIIQGPSFAGHKLQWRTAVHNGQLILPDNSKLQVGLMSFTALDTLKNKPFFVMPLPSFWKAAGVTSATLGLDNLVTGVFLHEFSHSQQMENFGKRLTAFEKNIDLGTDFNDDIIQYLFKSDTAYVKAYNAEVDRLYELAELQVKPSRQAVLSAINQIHQRQSLFFTDKSSSLSTIDDFFLTMEGMGQFTMYKWLTHPQGANMPVSISIPGVRRGRNQWSQDEGLALFLLLERMSPVKKWAPLMFGKKLATVVELLQQYQ
ncbi:MAG: hypothetical protein EOO06_18650 [Chitinophagaceae bacterium]|nr:MAG: hypothetical protein EOO06_18650 [Chitinophagaceae bacterium]